MSEDTTENTIEETGNIDALRRLEALLFAAKKPLTVEEMEERLGVSQDNKIDVRALLRELSDTYESRGFNLVNTGNNWAFKTAADLADTLEHQQEEERTLSRAAMETLSIVAYHQPVTRAEIENIRGVSTSKGTLDILIEAGWVKPGRRRQVPGKPLTWITTDGFLDHFGLQTLMELPGLEELQSSGLLDKRPAIETLPGTPDMFEDEERIAQEEQAQEEEAEAQSENETEDETQEQAEKEATS
ncbi:MAG: SMC-Scp complex subunit ScpB [Micavibrio sp.]|nr:SMC-Scp complex subunit ScpB [Micavibrio sp.]HCK33377.1 SMC-Scp complex subunit ScpB [Rhodospirillaceae bacterium]